MYCRDNTNVLHVQRYIEVKHKTSAHHDNTTVRPLYCQQMDCSFSTHQLGPLHQHLVSIHNLKMETETLIFTNKEGKYPVKFK